ncbi:hypothetical protein [Streptomyces sp. NPDC005336]|uniref:hypothetical protein n=1 Tax=unclassified Streptomyces TaxID=2593676 RepID=UPI0033A0E432
MKPAAALLSTIPVAALFFCFERHFVRGANSAFEVAGRGLGLPDDAAEGATVRVELPGAGPVDAVVDYRNPYFIGLRTDDAMYRLFGRNHSGAPVGVGVHDFAPGADAQRTGDAWRTWLGGLFA